MKGKILISAIAAISCLVLAIPVQAGIFGAGLGGALHGVIAGDLIDGRSGAPEGAVIGGLLGAGQAASSEKEQPNEAALQRKAEWEASEKAEQESIRQQKAEAALQKVAVDALVVETQKTSIRHGFDPGEIGVTGHAHR